MRPMPQARRATASPENDERPSEGASTASPSAEPVRTCVPMAGDSMRFGDVEAKVGDGGCDLLRFPFETSAER